MKLTMTLAKNKMWDRCFVVVGLVALLVGLVTLLGLIVDLAMEGVPKLSFKFFFSYPSRFAEGAGILSAWVGTIWVMVVCALSAVPLGICAGIYLEEYAKKNWVTDLIEINIANLAGVPSIIYGLMALGIFVHGLKLGPSVLTAGLTLALLILPIVIMATREAIRAIPIRIREAAYALGATQWETIRDHILPYSTGGILTGVIIGLSRAIGETAPLITIGALTFIAFLPHSVLDSFTVMPIQMFNWVSRPQEAFQANAAAAGLVLMAMTLAMNGLAFYVRYRFREKIKW